MLEVRHLNASYGQHPALQDVAISVGKGEVVAILGANGAGKSTLLRAIAGICEGKVSGEVSLSGKSILGLSPDAIVESGVALVPEGRGIFGDLTVKENLGLGAYTARARATEKKNLERVLSLFPKVGERQNQIARTMSGGEQQMVAIGRAMMSAPDILMLDEPSLGLAPLLCKELFDNLAQVKELGIGILLVEQNAKQSLAIADRGYLLENTRITHEDSAAKLANDPAVQKAYLGGSVSTPSQATKKIQKEAHRSTSVPASPATAGSNAFTTSVGEVRRSADQQIGGSIDDLVAQATETSATNATNATNAGTDAGERAGQAINNTPTTKVSSSQLERVVMDIEQAAEAARERARSRRSTRSSQATPAKRPAQTSTTHHSTNGNGAEKPTTETENKPVVIEVYKRPRVEVYRRRPTGEFERQ